MQFREMVIRSKSTRPENRPCMTFAANATVRFRWCMLGAHGTCHSFALLSPLSAGCLPLLGLALGPCSLSASLPPFGPSRIDRALAPGVYELRALRVRARGVIVRSTPPRLQLTGREGSPEGARPTVCCAVLCCVVLWCAVVCCGMLCCGVVAMLCCESVRAPFKETDAQASK